MTHNQRKALIVVLLVIGVIAWLNWRTSPHMVEEDRLRKERDAPFEQVRDVVKDRYSCTPSFRHIRRVGSDPAGTAYIVGCGRWTYSVFVSQQGQTIFVDRLTEWDGR
jgi:hypothetical protein